MAYNKHDWVTGELITADKMNAIEEGIDNIDEMTNDTLIESNFKGRTKYLKGIDIDSSSGRGTLIFYDGANKANESKIDFYTVESSPITKAQIEQLGFFTTDQGNEYVVQKVREQFNENFSNSFTNAFNERIDSSLSSESSNPVQNKIITEALNNKLSISNIDEGLDENSTHTVQNKVIKEKLSLLNYIIINIE